MDRRQALRSLGVAGSLGLAGCSSVLGSSGTVLGRIEVINASFTARTVRLAVERGDETLIDRQVSLGPADAADGSAWTKIQPTWSDTQSQYRIWALHLDEEGERASTSWEYTVTRADYDTYYEDEAEDPGCIGALVKIGDFSEAEYPPIGISPTYVENPCGTADRTR
ncbi:hypothetical protein ACFQMA_17420 [Halosimplex aquaticum]|uniref:Uncharacterized protein n=1 Tax=Halosimplex aquaticum TaxID=3026162 RepID=A0ABD5Y5N2_9EURY|nr:hypothetical protein [Halosimplex aquaticum]